MKKIKIAVIAGEESGDQLGSDLIQALERKLGQKIELIGVGGAHLEKLGLKSLFPSQEIALMGLGMIIKNLARLIKHIRDVAFLVVKEQVDALLIIDSQEFTHRVAKKVRKLAPNIPIIQYVAPSVWAWRPERAKHMKTYIDHLLVVLPFEEQVMKDLNGPSATYVGHRLTNYAPLIKTQDIRQNFVRNIKAPTILLLPGSRSFEIEKLMPIFGQTVSFLQKNYPQLKILLPTLEKIYPRIKQLAENWSLKPEIYVDETQKWQAFETADIALAASGTVSLELSLCKIPMILSYKMDWFSKIFIRPRITIWSAALPNIITDTPLVPEFFNEFVHPKMLAHQLRYLLQNDYQYQAQLEGFERLRKLMKHIHPAGEIGAEKIIEILKLNTQ